MNNFFIIVLDGVGIGELPDAHLYNDEGSDTLTHIAEAVGNLKLSNLTKLGLGNIKFIPGLNTINNPAASFGKLCEVSKGKDSITGHWELAGLKVAMNFSYFPHGFPDSVMEDFIKQTGLQGYLGNKAASGTQIIDELGADHINTGFPIVYTSADSVFQIAAHEKYFGLENLYHVCSITRDKVLKDPVCIGRVIARPFLGEPGNFKRTTNRKDYSLNPPKDTVLDVLSFNNIKTVAIGKINDLFNYRGIQTQEKTKSNADGCNKLLEYASKVADSFIFANLVDFDVNFGHRNDPIGFAKALEEFDLFLEEFLNVLDVNDRLIITADHGNDPTTPSTDHSREYVPLLYFGKNKKSNNLGVRKIFSDVGKTVADFFKVNNHLEGISFLEQ